MTGPAERVAVTAPPHPEAPADRLRSRLAGDGGGDGAGFEALLAEAASRHAGQPGPELDAGSGAQPWRRPAGALGSSRPAATGSPSAVGFGMVAGGAAMTGGLVEPGRPESTGVVFPMAWSVGQAVVNAGAEHLGVPYLWGGTDPVKGFDCSGLVQDAYRAIGVEMPKWSRHQATMGAEIPSIEAAVPGDVIAFGEPVDHVALYVGDGKMLHAPKTGEVVKIEPIDRPIATIRRIVTAGPGAGVRTVSPAGAPFSLAPGAPVAVAHPPESFPSTGRAEQEYGPLFESAGRRWNVDPALLAAVAETESGFDRRAISPAGAQGLMQFMPATAAEMGVDPWDPASAIDGAARYLRTSLDRFGSAELAIASYNAGPGAVARHAGIPPFAETQNYVRKVLDAWRRRP